MQGHARPPHGRRHAQTLAGHGSADTPMHRDPGGHSCDTGKTHVPEPASPGATGSAHPERGQTAAPEMSGRDGRPRCRPVGPRQAQGGPRGHARTLADSGSNAQSLSRDAASVPSSSTAEPQIEQPVGSPSLRAGGCLCRGGGAVALVTAQPPPPAALAPRLRGPLSASKLSLGSGTAKRQRSGRCLPGPSPTGGQLLGAGRRGVRETAIQGFKFHRARPPKTRDIRCEAETVPLMFKHSQHPTSQARPRLQ